MSPAEKSFWIVAIIKTWLKAVIFRWKFITFSFPFTEKSPVFLFFFSSLMGASTFPPSRRLLQMILRLRHEYLPAGAAEVAPPRRGRNCSGQTCLVSRSRRDGGQVSFPAASAASFIHPASVFIVPGGVGAFICLATLTTPRSYFTAVLFPSTLSFDLYSVLTS